MKRKKATLCPSARKNTFSLVRRAFNLVLMSQAKVIKLNNRWA